MANYPSTNARPAWMRLRYIYRMLISPDFSKMCHLLSCYGCSAAILQYIENNAILCNVKTDTHPTYFSEAKVTCACGRVFNVGSTKEKIEVEICSNCHPFYTGDTKLMDSAGRVEKFKARKAAATKKAK